jgi:hypothetical protein
MEIHWDVRSTTVRDSWGNEENTYHLEMRANAYIVVNGNKQLFNYSRRVQEPSNVKYCLQKFEKDANEFFNRIKHSIEDDIPE